MPKASDTTQRPWFHTTTYRMGDGGAHIAFRGVDRVHRVGSIDREADAALIVEAVNLYPQHKAEREALLRCAAALRYLVEITEAQGRDITPEPRRETVDEANSRDEFDQVFGDALARSTEALAALAQAQEAEE